MVEWICMLQNVALYGAFKCFFYMLHVLFGLRTGPTKDLYSCGMLKRHLCGMLPSLFGIAGGGLRVEGVTFVNLKKTLHWLRLSWCNPLSSNAAVCTDDRILILCTFYTASQLHGIRVAGFYDAYLSIRLKVDCGLFFVFVFFCFPADSRGRSLNAVESWTCCDCCERVGGRRDGGGGVFSGDGEVKGLM